MSSLQSQVATDDSPIETCVSLLKTWFEQCDGHHGDSCKITPIAERPLWQVPDWVIDTEEGCIVPGGTVQRYAALSYVWDTPSQADNQVTLERLMLRHDNIEVFQRPGSLSTGGMKGLPSVVRDSIDLILQAGIRYLWVDCLCIVQHADTTRARVDAMNEIYSGACVTIIAATTSGDLFGPKTDFSQAKEAVDLASPGRRHSTDSGPSQDAHSLYSSLLASHWATRGWTFQEHLLSKCCVNFIDETVFWDCECSVWWPGMPRMRLDSGDVGSPPGTDCERAMAYMVGKNTLGISSSEVAEVDKHKQLSRALKTPSIPNFRLYMELICRYNHRNLTYPQDALPAFSGVLRSITQESSNDFICGTPVHFIDAALLWQPLWKAKRRVCTDVSSKGAPAAPLPSWSWVGWQCLIDPESMISGLDYEVEVIDGKSLPPQSAWRTTKLVDWYALTDKDDRTSQLLKEYQLMESCKEFRSSPSARELPNGWSRKAGFEFVSKEKARFEWSFRAHLAKFGHTNVRELSVPSRPIEWFFHEDQDDTLYYYPIPTSDTSSPASTNLSDAAFLSCTTTTALLNVRRMLIFDHRTVLRGARSMIPLEHPVRDTFIYKRKPGLEDLNSVITLEDDEGRWAGLLKVMDDDTSVDKGQKIQLIAISKGSASRFEAADTYEANVDTDGRYHTHEAVWYSFKSSTSSQQTSETATHNAGSGRSPPSKKRCVSHVGSNDDRTNLDLGPFHFNDQESRGLSEWRQDVYSFYNVLWVETIDGVMYRKAAGRISEDVWEQTCGAPQRIVLG